MKIVVIGGTGLIGGRLVELLRKDGHEVTPASPSSGVNSVTGEGLAAAFAGADVVVDIPNSPDFADGPVMEFFTKSTGNIVKEAKAAGIRHHVVLSIVGADRMPNIGYMRAKVAQEDIAKDGGVPYTIVRATQFFEFVGALAEGGAQGDEVHLSEIVMQPIAAAEVSAALAAVATAEPKNATVELAGPEPLPLAELAARLLAARGDGRTVVTDPGTQYFGAQVAADALLPERNSAITGHRYGTVRFEEWLAV
jgi:uncharacterized protein YbjT (DUF2867 family)